MLLSCRYIVEINFLTTRVDNETESGVIIYCILFYILRKSPLFGLFVAMDTEICCSGRQQAEHIKGPTGGWAPPTCHTSFTSSHVMSLKQICCMPIILSSATIAISVMYIMTCLDQLTA